MANGYSATGLRRRRRIERELPDGSKETIYGEDRRSTPGSADSPRNASSFAKIDSNPLGGLSDNTQWDTFFNKKPLPDLTPTTPPAATAMAPIAERAGFFDDPKGFASFGSAASSVASFEPPSPTKYLQGAIAGSTNWFNRAGMATSASAPRLAGDSFKDSRYGSGSVDFDPSYEGAFKPAPGIDYIKKLKRLSRVGEFFG